MVGVMKPIFVPALKVELATVITFGLAFVAGIIIPILIYFVTRNKQRRDVLEHRADTSKDHLHDEIQKRVDDQLKDLRSQIDGVVTDQRAQPDKAIILEIRQDLKSLQEKVTEIEKSLLKQVIKNQQEFVTVEAYKADQRMQKNYMKVIYSTIKQELSAINGDDDYED